MPGWFGIKTAWFSLPFYRGPWSVRAARLSGSGRIDLGSESAAHPAPDPRTTWISGPGCYAFQLNGLGFSELIVFEALAPNSLTGSPRS